MANKIVTAYVPNGDLPVPTQTDYSKDDDIVEYEIKEYVVKTGEGDEDFVVKTRVVEKSRIKRQDYINSFRDDVGILNILAKVQATGDATLLDQKKGGSYIDISTLPDNVDDANKAIAVGVAAFDGLPEEIKKKMSMAEFVDKFGQEEFDALIAAKAVELAAKKKESEVNADVK